MTTEIKTGLAIHCHHDMLVEHCYNFDERVEAIKRTKPKNEVEIRSRLFKILPVEAEKDIPQNYLKACRAWGEADRAWDEAYRAWVEADRARKEADRAREEAYRAWPQESKNAFHKKWCGCKEWNGSEIVFEGG